MPDACRLGLGRTVRHDPYRVGPWRGVGGRFEGGIEEAALSWGRRGAGWLGDPEPYHRGRRVRRPGLQGGAGLVGSGTPAPLPRSRFLRSYNRFMRKAKNWEGGRLRRGGGRLGDPALP